METRRLRIDGYYTHTDGGRDYVTAYREATQPDSRLRNVWALAVQMRKLRNAKKNLPLASFHVDRVTVVGPEE